MYPSTHTVYSHTDRYDCSYVYDAIDIYKTQCHAYEFILIVVMHTYTHSCILIVVIHTHSGHSYLKWSFILIVVIHT